MASLRVVHSEADPSKWIIWDKDSNTPIVSEVQFDTEEDAYLAIDASVRYASAKIRFDIAQKELDDTKLGLTLIGLTPTSDVVTSLHSHLIA